jgi:hypothetical protein
MSVDTSQLQRACEDVLIEHIGPAAFIVAQDAIAGYKFLPNVPAAAQIAAFLVQLKSQLPADVPRDAITRAIASKLR